MADPLGVTGSIAGLVSLVIQLSQVSYQYISSVRGSSKVWSSYIQELSALTSVLLKLEQATSHVRSQDLSHILPAPGLSSASVRECHRELDTLNSTLKEKLSKQGLRGKLEMLSWPFSEPDTQVKVSMLHRFSSLFESSLVADNLTISVENYRQLKDIKDVREFEDLLSWFRPKYESLPLTSEVVLESLCPGTWSTFLNSDLYVNWRDSPRANSQQSLWIYGPPGSGKSVLSAAIVNNITSRSKTISAYHFFRDGQEETLLDVLRHIAYQLLSQPATVSKVAIYIFKKKMAQNASLLLKDLVDVICDISVTSSPTYIILDGLDEFPHLNKILKYLPQFVTAKAKVLIASRELPSITAYMSNAVLIDARVEHRDIEFYVDWRLGEDSEVEQNLLSDGLKKDIVSKVIERASGSFLLARLIMDSICNATTVKKIRTVVDLMPINYEEAYKSTFDRIFKQDEERQHLALSALSWICNSRRSLNMAELRHAIASLDDAPEYTVESLESDKAILSSCLGFLTHSKLGQTVNLVHLSAREFVLKQLNSRSTDSNIAIARACLRYMAVPEMAKGPCRSLDELKTRITEMPFLDYATRYYGYHVRPVEDGLLSELNEFLSNERFREGCWQILHLVVNTGSQSAQNLLSGVPSQATILHVACYWGFFSLLRKLLATSSAANMLNRSDSHGWSPLHWASSNGHPQLAAGLLDAGSNINVIDKTSWTPLFWAVVRGHGTVTQLLLDRGSDPFEKDNNGLTPLHWAILSGAEEMITLLLHHVKNSDHPSRPRGPSFSTSRLTVEDAKATATPKQSRNLFQLVTEISDKESFEKLARSFDPFISHKYEDAGFAMKRVSALWDQTKIVLSKGEIGFWWRMQENAPIDGVRRQLLTNAIQCEDIELVKAILDLSRDLERDLASDVVSKRGAGYVHVAAYSGSSEIMHIIRQTGLSLTATDSRKLTPLHYACRSGTPEIVEIILDANVEVDARDNEERTPLMLLLRFGGWRTSRTPGDALVILKALVAKGASIHAEDSKGHQAIHYSMWTMDPDIIQALLDLGADLGAASKDLRTPLHVLADSHDSYSMDLQTEGFSRKFSSYKIPTSLAEAVAELVLQSSPPNALRAETSTNTTALALAIKSRSWILAQGLHAAKAPFQCNNDLSDTLKVVSENGFYEFVQIVVKAGATTTEQMLPEISAVLPAKKPHLWQWSCADISESQVFPRRSHALALKYLLALGVDVNFKSGYFKMTAIQLATERGIDDSSYLAALLEGGADPYAETYEGLDSFDLALFCGNLDNLAVLIQHASHDTSRDHWLTNWLRESGTVPKVGQESFDACISAIRHSALHAAYDRNGHTLLFHAVTDGNRLLAEELIKLGSDVNFSDALGWTPLHEAARTHRMDMMELLVSNGANVFATVTGTSPYSMSTGTVPNYGEDEPAINALHIAVGIRPHNMDLEARNRLSPDIVRYLLENGIDPNGNAINVSGLPDCAIHRDSPPLHIMFRKFGPERKRDFFAVVQLLVDFGADVRGISEWLEPWEIALFEGFESLWDVFRNVEPESSA
ncbi:ankyrin repeat-containing domain protein [Rhexocercosporidium sp. MPI-PUGE-AT-0058]|nr:ankyrin repeat-containing domain protein [Rhexocercosporidium sp. MPI-PUGE-AT-0058]